MNAAFVDQIWVIFRHVWEKTPELLLTLVFGYLLIKLIKVALHAAVNVSHANRAMKGVLISVIDIALWIFLLAAMLQQIGLTQIALALSGTVAIAGIAISVGASAFVQDLVSGLFLAQDPDFNVGDTLQVEGVTGVIEKMDARKIRLRDKDGKLHVFPNSNFDKNAWIVIEKEKR